MGFGLMGMMGAMHRPARQAQSKPTNAAVVNNQEEKIPVGKPVPTTTFTGQGKSIGGSGSGSAEYKNRWANYQPKK